MKHVAKSTRIEDYPNILAYLKDQGLGEIDLQLLAIEATVQSDDERAERVETELGWTMLYYEDNIRGLIADPHAQQEMPHLIASLAIRFPGPPAWTNLWPDRDAFTRSDHV